MIDGYRWFSLKLVFLFRDSSIGVDLNIFWAFFEPSDEFTFFPKAESSLVVLTCEMANSVLEAIFPET
jgi:hypothetical protein